MSDVEKSFLCCTGIGPVLEARLKGAGFEDWQSILDAPAGRTSDFPLSARRLTSMQNEIRELQGARAEGDLVTLLKRLPVREHWRVLAEQREVASYFDIETTGLTMGSHVTVIGCLHEGQRHSFVRGENLDDFLDLALAAKLLVSFNGGSFDVPWVLREFHIPELPCAHIDLRWVTYHRGYQGGQKSIETQMGLQRGERTAGISGEDAVVLWQRWLTGCEESRSLLIDYCLEDAASLEVLTERLLG